MLEAGDVNARVWIRIREVEQSLSLIDADPRPAAGRRDLRSTPSAERRAGEGMALVEGFRGDVLVWLRLDADGTDRALPSARSVLVPVAAAGGGDRGQHRRRLPALQQIVQLLLFGARSLGHAMRKILFESLAAPAADRSRRPRRTTRRWPSSPRSVDRAARRRLGRSLSIREVDAGSCNGCELEIHALNNAFYDLERFGLRFVASPRHADVLLVTGPVTKNMREALERTYDATPDPKWVVAVGDCARRRRHLRRQLCRASAACRQVVPVDLHIRGCPPTPDAIARRVCWRCSIPRPRPEIWDLFRVIRSTNLPARIGSFWTKRRSNQEGRSGLARLI